MKPIGLVIAVFAFGSLEAAAHVIGVHHQIADVFDVLAGVAAGAYLWREI